MITYNKKFDIFLGTNIVEDVDHTNEKHLENAIKICNIFIAWLKIIEHFRHDIFNGTQK